MAHIRLRSTVGLISALVLGAALAVGGCGGGGGGGSGGKRSDAAVGTGGKGTGGSGGTTTKQDAGRDVAVTGGAGGTTAADVAADVPIGTGGIDGSTIDAGIDVGGIDGPMAATMHLYVGCADSAGTIELYGLDGLTGASAPLSNFTVGGAISNTEFNATEERMYIAHVINGASMLSTFTRNPTSGALTLLGSPVAVPYAMPVAGGGVDGGVAVDGGGSAVDAGPPPTNAGPQTLTFDRSRKFMAVPNYFSGNVYVYSMAKDESVDSLVAYDGAGSNAHHAVFTLNNKFMFVPYLGSNLIQVYAFNASTGALTRTGSATLPNASSGPRHLALHSNGKWLYSINETAGGASSATGSIDFFTVDQTAGTVSSHTTFNVPLPTGYTGLKNGSEIEIAPSGNVLIVSMRLDNKVDGSLVSYRIDAATGALSRIEQVSSHGATPRHFSLSKDGTLLVLGNQNSNTLAVFNVDPTAGSMTFLGDRAVCTSPRFARMADIK